MSERVYIEIDASPWMDANGVTTSVFLGDAGEPSYENIFTFKELIDRELDAHTIHGKLTGDNVGYAEELVIALEEAAKYARTRFEELKDE